MTHISLVLMSDVVVDFGELHLEEIFILDHTCDTRSIYQGSDLGRDLLLVVVDIISRFGNFSEYSCCSSDDRISQFLLRLQLQLDRVDPRKIKREEAAAMEDY